MVYDIDGNNIGGGSSSGEHWKNKVWYAYGTSLTAYNKYTASLAQLSGLSLNNKGVAGGALVANRNVYNRLMDNTDGKVNADLITIEVGANDGSATLGTPLDLENTTFCGALNVCIKNILTNCPKAQVVLMDSTRARWDTGGSLENPNTLDQVTSGGFTYLQRSEAIRQVAEANGIYYIPFGSGLGLGLYRELSSNLYNVDAIHHSDLGGYNLAQGIWCYLKNIPLWYNSMPN